MSDTPIDRDSIAATYETIRPHLRERQRLVDLFFEEKLEYPTFAWQETIVNAVARRDYRYEGLEIAIGMLEGWQENKRTEVWVEPDTLVR